MALSIVCASILGRSTLVIGRIESQERKRRSRRRRRDWGNKRTFLLLQQNTDEAKLVQTHKYALLFCVSSWHNHTRETQKAIDKERKEWTVNRKTIESMFDEHERMSAGTFDRHIITKQDNN